MIESKVIKSVGVIGVGAMGLAFAERFLAVRFDVFGYRRSEQADLKALGGRPTASAAELAELADLLLILLPNDEALGQVTSDLAEALSPDQIVVCLSSHRLEAKNAAKEIVEGKNAVLLDAEVSGTPEMVRSKQASVLIAGEGREAEQVASVFNSVVGSVQRLPAFGDAVKLKLLSNYLVAAHTLAAADALVMAEDMGFEPARAIEVLTASAGSSRMLEIRGPLMVKGKIGVGDFEGFVGYLNRLREVAGGSELLDYIELSYRHTLEHGGAGKDLTAVYTTLRKGPLK